MKLRPIPAMRGKSVIWIRFPRVASTQKSGQVKRQGPAAEQEMSAPLDSKTWLDSEDSHWKTFSVDTLAVEDEPGLIMA